MTIDLRCGDYHETLADVTCDALICDCPYSDRTHSGFDGASRRDASTMFGGKKPGGAIPYAKWSQSDVAPFVDFWHERTRGWFCTLTDHVLARAWEEELRRVGRYVFSPIACVETGSRIRLGGDGPAQWSTWLVVARPSTREFQHWGSLPGAYVQAREAKLVMGGKGLDTMRAIVRDYSRPGDVVCDPCAGGATTLIASVIEGRRAIGSELDPVTHAKAMNRIATSGEIERYAPSDALKHAKQARLF